MKQWYDQKREALRGRGPDPGPRPFPNRRGGRDDLRNAVRVMQRPARTVYVVEEELGAEVEYDDSVGSSQEKE